MIWVSSWYHFPLAWKNFLYSFLIVQLCWWLILLSFHLYENIYFTFISGSVFFWIWNSGLTGVFLSSNTLERIYWLLISTFSVLPKWTSCHIISLLFVICHFSLADFLFMFDFELRWSSYLHVAFLIFILLGVCFILLYL